MCDLPYSNYPAGVTDNDFNDDPEGVMPRMGERKPKPIDYGPEHAPDCQCEECECSF